MITFADLKEISVIPYVYHCCITNEFIATKIALGIRHNETNYYFSTGMSPKVYADWIHKMNGQSKSIQTT